LTYLYSTFLTPFLLIAMLRPLSFGRINYIPAGPTALVFALLAQYHAIVPYIYKYRVSGSSSPSSQSNGIMLTSKATSYLLPAQLALSQLPGSALAAAVGWVVGIAYRREILQGAVRWRVPTWLVAAGYEQKERYNHLRRRMEGEAAAGRATGVERDTNGSNAGGEEQARRRGVVGGLLDQFRGAL
jgi:hypothetical protein